MIQAQSVQDISMPRLQFLAAPQLHFFKRGADLSLTIAGQRTLLKVIIKKAFPLSLPNSFFSIRDGEGCELGLLASLSDLAPDSRHLVEEELRRRYLIAIIRRVRRVTERFGTVDWEVETNRGLCQFTTRDLRKNAIRIGQDHFLLVGTENNLFEVPNIRQLDRRSRAWLLRHL